MPLHHAVTIHPISIRVAEAQLKKEDAKFKGTEAEDLSEFFHRTCPSDSD